MAGFRIQRWDSSDPVAISKQCNELNASLRYCFLLSEKDASLIPVIQKSVTDGLRISGALFPALLADGRFDAAGCIVIEMQAAPEPVILENASSEACMADNAARMAQYVKSLPANEPAALFCIFDALIPNIGTQLDTWYLHVADRVRLFGVNAGSESFTAIDCLFDNERLYRDAVLLQILPDHPGAILEHGYPAPAEFITATSAEGNKIIQIDWQPALDRYRQIMFERKGVEVTRENFYNYAVHFPFGIMRADGEVLVRIPVGLTEDGSIYCIGEIPANSFLTLLDAAAGSHKAPARLAESLNAMSDSSDLLLFYCAGRRLHRGPEAEKEIDEIRSRGGFRNILGALSLGEIGTSHQSRYPLFHNATLVGVPCR